MIKFAYTILYVQNVEKSIDFYERAFGFRRKFIAPVNAYGELQTGDATLSFASIALARANMKDGFQESSLANKPFAIEIGFTTENVQEVYDKAIREGAVAEAEPKLKPHGQTVAYVRDIDGFLVEICTPMG
ncbi:MAG TPA: VOC family protein [Flavobacterium sp.]|nr:VOC family protein [Flavobacterium sp.]